MDIISVNGSTFFTSISHKLYYRTTQYIPNTKSSTFQQCLEQLIRLYRKRDCYIKKIYCDNEFKKAFNTFTAEDYNIYIPYVAPQSHLRGITEQLRKESGVLFINYHSPCYQKVAECANKLNYFPAKLGLSKHYSPRMILQKQTLEFKTHGMYNTGDYPP